VPGLALILLLGLAAQLAVAQPSNFTLPAGLVADGIPAIPASVADEVRRYTEFRGASFANWHPASREMLISMRAGNLSQIHRVRAPGGAREQLTSQNEPLTTASYERRSGAYFLLLKDVGGNEFSQIYRYDFPKAEITLLTDGGRSQNGDIRWSRRGDRIAYASTRRNGADRDLYLYLMDPAKPDTQRMLVQVQGGGWAEQIVAAARKNATPVWYLLGTNEGHGFRKKENVDAQFYAMVQFVRQFLVAQSP
jgi:dipeptidyl aminopeptidase/acylaminoacyl peptidase